MGIEAIPRNANDNKTKTKKISPVQQQPLGGAKWYMPFLTQQQMTKKTHTHKNDTTCVCVCARVARLAVWREAHNSHTHTPPW